VRKLLPSSLLFSLIILLVACAGHPSANETIWAGVGGAEWHPPRKLDPDVEKLLSALTDSAERNFAKVNEYPLSMTRITLRVAFDPRTRKLKILQVKNANSQVIFETVQISVKEALSGIHLTPDFQKWVEKIDTITFIF